MADPRPTRSGAGEIGILPIVIGAVIVIGLAVWFFLGVGIDEPVPLPDSPVATGTVGQPAGVTGEGPIPGAPPGADAPPGAPVAEPNPDLAPGTGVDTTRGAN